MFLLRILLIILIKIFPFFIFSPETLSSSHKFGFIIVGLLSIASFKISPSASTKVVISNFFIFSTIFLYVSFSKPSGKLPEIANISPFLKFKFSIVLKRDSFSFLYIFGPFSLNLKIFQSSEIKL